VTRWLLLLRGVNVGRSNRIAMADLRTLLADLGHGDVRTFLNSGNATFTSRRRGRGALVAEVEAGLRDRHGLDVGVTVRTAEEVQEALDALPDQVAASAYVLVTFLLAPPDRKALAGLADWDTDPDLVVPGDGVVYLGYAGPMHASKLQNATLEKRLGVRSTARTPETLRRMLG